MIFGESKTADDYVRCVIHSKSLFENQNIIKRIESKKEISKLAPMNQDTNLLTPIPILIRKGMISAIPGTLSVSQTEVLIEEKSKYLMMFGLLGLLFKNSLKSKYYHILPDQLASVKKTSFGMNQEVLEFALKDGNTHTLIVKPNLEKVVSSLSKLSIQVQ